MRKLILAASIFMASHPLLASSLDIEDQWVREAPPGMQMMAGYATLKNPTAKDIVVTSVQSPAFSDIEMHTTKIVDGIAKMEEQKTLIIPASGELKLAPGGFHLMLMMPKERYTEGRQLDMTLNIEGGESQTISFEVKKDGKMKMDHSHDHHHDHKH